PRLLRELLDVRAVVAVLGWLLPTSRGFNGRAKAIHLRAGVVVVILARHLVPAEVEQARDRVAVRAVARGRNRDGPRPVRRRQLDLHPLTRLRPAACEVFSGSDDS